MAGWLVPRGDLTNDQARAVEMAPDRNRVFAGGPGSGKTLVLLHRARHLADTLGVRPGRFLVLVYTNALTAYLRAAVAELGLPADCARTYDDWCAEHWERFVAGPKPHRSDGAPAFDAIRHGVRREVLRSGRRRPLYDFVLVDEGQDLDADAFDVLARVSAHVTVAFDPRQRIYDRGASESELLAALGLFSCSVTLLESFRFSPHVAGLAARLLPDAAGREAFLRQVRTTAAGREKPLVYLARDDADEADRLALLARARLLRGERVAVLLPTRGAVLRVARDLCARGVPVETPRPPGEGEGPFPPLDFSSDLVKVMPFHGAKGLTFDSVFLPHLVGQDLRAWNEASLRRLLFVGLTRASSWVCLFLREDEPLPLFAGTGLVSGTPEAVVQRAADAPVAQAAANAPVPVTVAADELTGWL